MKKPYDSTVARIAGNLLSGADAVYSANPAEREWAAKQAVLMARAIIAEVKRTEPQEDSRELDAAIKKL